MTEEVEVVLMSAFESPKPDKIKTRVTFGFLTDGQYEKGWKPLDMWYDRKGIISQFTPEMYGRKVKARCIYVPDMYNPNNMRRIVKEFDLDGRTYQLV